MHPAFLRKSEEEILDLSAPHSPLIAGYDCPAGSAIFFTEALCQYVQSPLALLAACGCVQRQISPPRADHVMNPHIKITSFVLLTLYQFISDYSNFM